jgi:hypothetical protein
MNATATDRLVTPDELAQTLHTYSGTLDPIPWDDLDEPTRRRLQTQARRTIERLNDRRLTHPQRHAIQRLKSAAREIAEDTATAIDEALADLHGDEHSNAGSRAVLDLIQRLDDDGHIDIVAGASPLEEALRRARDAS